MTASSRPSAGRGILHAAMYRLRSSRSIASMLPSLLLSGVIMLVMTAVMHLMWKGATGGFFGAWMESWLITWPIAFPVTYVIWPALQKLASLISAPTAKVETSLPGQAIADPGAEQEGFTVLRDLKSANDFSMV